MTAMTTSTRQLLAGIHQWARTNGWTNTSRGWIDATSVNDARVAVLPDPDDQAPAVIVTWRRGNGGWARQIRYDVADTGQAIDVLVALDILPAQFARAFRAGWLHGWCEAATDNAATTRPDRRCRHCGATSGLKMLHSSPLTIAAREWECATGCADTQSGR